MKFSRGPFPALAKAEEVFEFSIFVFYFIMRASERFTAGPSHAGEKNENEKMPQEKTEEEKGEKKIARA